LTPAERKEAAVFVMESVAPICVCTLRIFRSYFAKVMLTRKIPFDQQTLARDPSFLFRDHPNPFLGERRPAFHGFVPSSQHHVRREIEICMIMAVGPVGTF
jgi:hypothetical protein